MDRARHCFRSQVILSALITILMLSAVTVIAQDVLPFPSPPMGGKVGPTMQESVPQVARGATPSARGRPQIYSSSCSTMPGSGNRARLEARSKRRPFRGWLKKASLTTVFHTTAMCSPTRAALMTGRNHHRVGAGIIAEFRQRLGRLQRRHSENVGYDCGGPRLLRLCHSGFRQGPQHTGRADCEWSP